MAAAGVAGGSAWFATLRPYLLALSVLLIVLVIVAAAYYVSGSAVPAGQQPLARLDASNFSELRSAFNEAKDSVRIVALLSPT